MESNFESVKLFFNKHSSIPNAASASIPQGFNSTTSNKMN